NRDGKKGKKQILIGLLCDGEGRPLSIEVFAGNTNDGKTFFNQVKKVAQRFGGGEVSLVGDRGMIRNPQIEDLQKEGFHYITANTKPQIESLLQSGTLQMSLFDQELCEVQEQEIRYILRRNPQRAAQQAKNREEKLQKIKHLLEEKNHYLLTHKR